MAVTPVARTAASTAGEPAEHLVDPPERPTRPGAGARRRWRGIAGSAAGARRARRWPAPPRRRPGRGGPRRQPVGHGLQAGSRTPARCLPSSSSTAASSPTRSATTARPNACERPGLGVAGRPPARPPAAHSSVPSDRRSWLAPGQPAQLRDGASSASTSPSARQSAIASRSGRDRLGRGGERGVQRRWPGVRATRSAPRRGSRRATVELGGGAPLVATRQAAAEHGGRQVPQLGLADQGEGLVVALALGEVVDGPAGGPRRPRPGSSRRPGASHHRAWGTCQPSAPRATSGTPSERRRSSAGAPIAADASSSSAPPRSHEHGQHAAAVGAERLEHLLPEVAAGQVRARRWRSARPWPASRRCRRGGSGSMPRRSAKPASSSSVKRRSSSSSRSTWACAARRGQRDRRLGAARQHHVGVGGQRVDQLGQPGGTARARPAAGARRRTRGTPRPARAATPRRPPWRGRPGRWLHRRRCPRPLPRRPRRRAAVPSATATACASRSA